MKHPEVIVPVAFEHTSTATCTPGWYIKSTEYNPARATFEPLVNGEEAFGAVHLAIAEAVQSIDIICWGFQPSMYFIRDGQAPSIGELLKTKAAQGVRVRVLAWEMPLNLAGVGGEANLPGKGKFRVGSHAMQSSTPAQYAEDRAWFDAYAIADGRAMHEVARGIPVLVSRGFSLRERREIFADVKNNSLDADISKGTRLAHAAAPSHHQKSVIVDFEVPEVAVGFVMGHNMLDEYWDTEKHSGLNRTPATKPAPNRGARGNTPRQDISSRISGPVLADLHHNFATAWFKETGEDLLVARNAAQIKPTLKYRHGVTRQMAQMLVTQPQRDPASPDTESRKEIQEAYLQAANNAAQFIYIENQYFRWPPLAEVIKAAAANQVRDGRNPDEHGVVHLFVVTNASEEGIGPGALNTQRMLESLGRADTIPKVTQLRRIKAARDNAPPKPRPDLRDSIGQRELKEWQASLNKQVEAIKDQKLEIEEIPGLKVHVCSLVAPDTPEGTEWMPVYIHSKLMIVDDAFTTHGSANVNTRSMQVDSELNIAHEWVSVTKALRRRLWGMHTGMEGAQDDAGEAFKSWGEIIRKNKDLLREKKTPYAPLVEFFYEKETLVDLD
ncbi:phospholipase [Pseudomonas sp. App30]|uniref:phospholipase D-like domain-containing protein n=1 Tax=Pseudomonas sp. App30 TaxID=3068990 RepID=UPI003A8061E7